MHEFAQAIETLDSGRFAPQHLISGTIGLASLPTPCAHAQGRAAYAAERRIAGGTAMTDAQVQLFRALKAHKSELEIERDVASGCDLEERIEAVGKILRRAVEMKPTGHHLLEGPEGQPRRRGSLTRIRGFCRNSRRRVRSLEAKRSAARAG